MSDPNLELFAPHEIQETDKKLRRNKDVRLGVPERHDWNTPQIFLDVLYRHSPVALDPCSNANSRVQSNLAYVLERGEDGLALHWRHKYRLPNGDWCTLTFCNPPYGDALPDWCQKAIDEAKQGAEIVLLTPVRTDTGWFDALHSAANALAFWKGRLVFEIPGKPDEPAPFASLVTYFGKNRYRFAAAFEERANIWLL